MLLTAFFIPSWRRQHPFSITLWRSIKFWIWTRCSSDTFLSWEISSASHDSYLMYFDIIHMTYANNSFISLYIIYYAESKCVEKVEYNIQITILVGQESFDEQEISSLFGSDWYSCLFSKRKYYIADHHTFLCNEFRFEKTII